MGLLQRTVFMMGGWSPWLAVDEESWKEKIQLDCRKSIWKRE